MKLIGLHVVSIPPDASPRVFNIFAKHTENNMT